MRGRTQRWIAIGLLTCGLAGCRADPEKEARKYLAGMGLKFTPKELANTRALVLKDKPIADEGVTHLRGLKRLRFLSLEGTKVTDAGLAPLVQFPALTILDLARNPITDAGLAHVGKLTRLRGLGLAGTKITDGGLAHLAGLENLTALHLGHTAISDAGLAHLHRLGALEKVNLFDTRVTDAGVAALVAARPGIQVVRHVEELAQPK